MRRLFIKDYNPTRSKFSIFRVQFSTGISVINRSKSNQPIEKAVSTSPINISRWMNIMGRDIFEKQTTAAYLRYYPLKLNLLLKKVLSFRNFRFG